MRGLGERTRASARRWAGIGLFASFSAATAHAEPSHPALHWSRADNAADCVDPRTLAELVETYTGPVLVPPAAADTSIESTIERTGAEEFRMRVSITVTRGRPAGQRTLILPAADCRKLDGAIAFVIASTLDPDLGRGSLPAELGWLQSETPPGEALRNELEVAPPPPQRQEASAQQPSPRSPESELVQAADEPWTESSGSPWELGIAIVAGKGPVPTAAAGGLANVTHGLSSAFALALQLRGNTSVGGFEIEGGRSVGVTAFDGALLACLRTDTARTLGFQGCLGPSVGFFNAVGEGFEVAHTVVQPLYGGQLKLEARYELADKLWLTAAGLLDVGFRRLSVNYTDLQTWHLVFRSDLYSLQGAIGLTRSF